MLMTGTSRAHRLRFHALPATLPPFKRIRVVVVIVLLRSSLFEAMTAKVLLGIYYCTQIVHDSSVPRKQIYLARMLLGMMVPKFY